MLYDVKTTRKLEKKIISQNIPELSLMFKAGTAIFNHIKELNKKIKGLVIDLKRVIPNGFILKSENDEEELRNQRQEELRKNR